jgi:glycosyltransferase involved in cell wall biosynthesis
MKLALLKGNRFNPWHLQAYARLDEVKVTAFRAESQVQDFFHGRDDGSLDFSFEPIYFDTQAGSIFQKLPNILKERYGNRSPRILPFAHQLEGFDVIQTWELFTDWTAQALDAKARFGTPVAVMVWDNIPFNNEPDPERKAMKQRTVREADRFIVHTERSRRMLHMEGVDDKRIVLIPPGVDADHFCQGDASRLDTGFGNDEFVILFVGWMLPRKGLDYLVLALRELCNDPELKDIRFRLQIVGEGPGRDRIERLISDTGVGGQCTFSGTYPYNEMPEVYRAADCFVLPSIAVPGWQEQFGMSLIEALACGVPCISTLSGSIPEIMGDAGDLCQPNDFTSLYESVAELATTPEKRERAKTAGRTRAENFYTLDAFKINIQKVYDGLTG